MVQFFGPPSTLHTLLLYHPYIQLLMYVCRGSSSCNAVECDAGNIRSDWMKE